MLKAGIIAQSLCSAMLPLSSSLSKAAQKAEISTKACSIQAPNVYDI